MTIKLKGLDTVNQIAQAIKTHGLSSVPLELIKTTRNKLKKLTIKELVALASHLKIVTHSENNQLIGNNKDEWIDVIAQYAHLA
jgi:hypothetical protein